MIDHEPVTCDRCGRVLQEAAPSNGAKHCPRCVSELTGIRRCGKCGDLSIDLDERGECARCAANG